MSVSDQDPQDHRVHAVHQASLVKPFTALKHTDSTIPILLYLNAYLSFTGNAEENESFKTEKDILYLSVA